MFYGGVVVEVGSRVLGSDTLQGFITQSVTNYLNLAGLIYLLFWTEHLWSEKNRGVTKLEWGTLIFLAASLVGLVGIHSAMDQILDAGTRTIDEPTRFGLFHKLYIGISSLQGVASLFLLFLTLRRWDAFAQKSRNP